MQDPKDKALSLEKIAYWIRLAEQLRHGELRTTRNPLITISYPKNQLIVKIMLADRVSNIKATIGTSLALVIGPMKNSSWNMYKILRDQIAMSYSGIDQEVDWDQLSELFIYEKEHQGVIAFSLATMGMPIYDSVSRYHKLHKDEFSDSHPRGVILSNIGTMMLNSTSAWKRAIKIERGLKTIPTILAPYFAEVPDMAGRVNVFVEGPNLVIFAEGLEESWEIRIRPGSARCEETVP